MIPARWQVTRATYRLPRNSTALLCGRLEHVLICRRRRRSSAAGGHREQGLGLAGLHNPAGGLGGTTGRQGPPSAGRSPSPGVTHSKRSSSHILPFDSLTVFQCHALWRRAVQLCVLGIIANHQTSIFDSILYQTFYFDFHGFCSDSPPLLARIDGPSVRFMTGAQLESSLMVERTMQGGTLPL